jgi:uncharacterized membrane protein YccC
VRSALRQVVASVLKVNWSQFEGAAALRCTIGVGAPLLVGLAIHQPLVSVFGAAGAVGVGFGSFQGAYRSRAAAMLFAAAGMAFSIFIGSLAGDSNVAAIAVAVLWGFAGGLLVALGNAASFVGLQSIVAALISAGFPSDLEGAAVRAVLAFGGGLMQTLLVVMIWPLRRFAAERRSLATAYRSLAAYASTIPAAQAAAPEPHTFAGTPSLLADPQPFAKSGEVLVFQALLDEAERIRASLAALATQHRRLADAPQSCASTLLFDLSAHALAEIAAALEEGREPRELSGLSQSLADCAGRLPPGAGVEPLLGQIRAAWRTAGVLTAAPGYLTPRREQIAPLRWRPPVRDALNTLRANLTWRSTACRHALRLAATLAIAAGGACVFELPRGYWLPLTVALVLKPDFHDTFSRSVARVAGTMLGAAGATVIAHVFAPGPIALVVLVLGFVWGGYALAPTNYTTFTVCITGYVVFLMTLAGVPEVTASTHRIINTVAAGALALCAYATWPSWTASEVRPALAATLEEQSGYVGALLAAYADPAPPDLKKLQKISASARLARSNSEAVVERMLTEPRGRYTMKSRTAIGLLAAIRRHALAALALHAGLERDVRDAVPSIGELMRQLTTSLLTLATAVRRGTAPPPLPPLWQTQLALNTASNDIVRDETDLLVDSVDTIAELLEKDGHGTT